VLLWSQPGSTNPADRPVDVFAFTDGMSRYTKANHRVFMVCRAALIASMIKVAMQSVMACADQPGEGLRGLNRILLKCSLVISSI
jgi:hypothetical protein